MLRTMIRALKDQKGNITIELLLVFLTAAVIAGSVLGKLLPTIKNLHEGMSNNIRDISGSGY
jgi:hypothetical protein